MKLYLVLICFFGVSCSVRHKEGHRIIDHQSDVQTLNDDESVKNDFRLADCDKILFIKSADDQEDQSLSLEGGSVTRSQMVASFLSDLSQRKKSSVVDGSRGVKEPPALPERDRTRDMVEFSVKGTRSAESTAGKKPRPSLPRNNAGIPKLPQRISDKDLGDGVWLIDNGNAIKVGEKSIPIDVQFVQGSIVDGKKVYVPYLTVTVTKENLSGLNIDFYNNQLSGDKKSLLIVGDIIDPIPSARYLANPYDMKIEKALGQTAIGATYDNNLKFKFEQISQNIVLVTKK